MINRHDIKWLFHGTRSMYIWWKNRDIIPLKLVLEYLWAKFKFDLHQVFVWFILSPILIPTILMLIVGGVLVTIAEWIMNNNPIPKKWIPDDFTLKIAKESKFTEIHNILKENKRLKKQRY